MPVDGARTPAVRDAAACAILVALVLAIPFLLGGERAVRAAFQDDAFYYARIARNVARGDGITFDGLHATSGFHPLWLAALVPVFVVLSGPMAPLVATVGVQIILVGGAAAVMAATLARVVDRRSAVAGGIVAVAVPWTGASLTGGLEGALTLAIVAAGWWLWLDASMRSRVEPSAWLGPGIVFALAGLARLEAFVFVPVALALGVRRMARPVTSIVALCAPGAFAVAIVVASSRALTRTWLPISATVKAAARLNRTESPSLPIVLGFGFAVFATVAIVIGVRRARASAASSVFILPAAGASLWISADLLAVGGLEPWNRIPVLLLFSVATAALASLWRGRSVVVVVILVGLARLPFAIARGPVPASSYGPYRWEAGVWLRDHLGADARIGSWNAGTIAYASDRKVVNLDGLVNDRAYFDEVLRGKGLEDYLRRERISWLADQSCGVDPTLGPYLARTGSLALARRTEWVASFYDRSNPDGCPGVAIWRLRGD
jgi:hypothetical protein